MKHGSKGMGVMSKKEMAMMKAKKTNGKKKPKKMTPRRRVKK
ncbi:hypothetical protein [uncultured Mediterranean phage uvMED]|nr:hypothetical protein [uncultured Mediterranean phage uvMED]